MNDGLVEMLRYNRWANLALLEAIASLPDAVLDTWGVGVSGSIRELLLHLVGGEQTQILRTKGRQHEGEWNRGSDWPGFAQLIAVAASTGAELIAIAEGLEWSETVDLAWMGKSFCFPKRFFLVHALEHGVEHRTEIKVALSALGIETPDLDGWQFASACGYGVEVLAGP